MRCSNCDFDNPASFKFCGQCGAPLTRSPHLPTSPSLHFPSAERRQLTVLFCDLVGSTALSEQLDPEELRDVIQTYQQTAAGVIKRFEGYIAQYLGDGLLVYFGYPIAHEHDAQRAALAGLGIIAELERFQTASQQSSQAGQFPRLEVRIGIHTGLVVVGEVGGGDRHEQLALGETTNVAARLQRIAVPNTVLISAATHRLIQGFFDCRALGPHILKGISRPLEAYRVLRPNRAHNRLDAALASHAGLTPLVGREQELARLQSCWAKVKASQGQVILLSGEAGIGKSRLVQIFKEQLTGEAHFWLTSHASPYYQNSRLYPIIELLQRLLRFKSSDSPEQKLKKLETSLKQFGLPLPEVVPLFIALFSLPWPAAYSPLNLTPQRQKQKTIDALLAVLLKLTDHRPVVIVVEDLHWVDPSTLEMLDALVDQVPKLPVLALFTFRPEFRPPWPGQTYLTQLTLARLPRPQVERLINHIAAGKALPSELLRQIIVKTDGVPIFVEELTKMVLELDLLEEQNGRYRLREPFPKLAIPATLHDSLMARLDRLGPVREVAQLGATLGREFNYQLLQTISPLDDAALQESLAQLVEAELLYQRGLPPQAVYTFKHALVQDTAYRSLLRRKRQEYHQQIAQVLAEQFPELGQTEPELLAHHYTAAGLTQQAISYWQQAGQQAVGQSGNLEAINHYKKALELLSGLPETSERIQQELHLHIALGVPLLMTRGYGAPEVEATYDRARQLAQQLPETPQLPSILFGLWVFYLSRGQHQTALELAGQLLHLATQTQEPALLLEAHQALGISYFNLGQLSLAREHLEAGLALYDPHRHGLRQAAAYIAADRGVTCLSHLALTLWLLGYPDQALRRCREALTLAGKLNHPYSLVFARFFAAWLHQFRREARPTQEHAAAAASLAGEHGFTLLKPLAHILEGWALTQQDQAEAGIEQIFRELAEYRLTGAQIGRQHLLAMLAEAHAAAGQWEAGLAVLTGALLSIEETEERFCEAELYRLKGELLLEQADITGQSESALIAEAEDNFRQSLQIARSQQARSLELRTALNLGRLYNRQGRFPEARQLLTACCDQFGEDAENTELGQAKMLLETIS